MKIIKMSVDTFWKGEVRVQGQIEDETKVYQTRIFIKGSQIYDYSCLVRREIHSGVPAFMQKRFRRRLPASRKPSIHRRFRLRRRSG